LAIFAACNEAPSFSSVQLTAGKVSVLYLDGRTEELSPTSFAGSKSFDKLTFSPDRRYVSWEVNYGDPDGSNLVPLEVVVLGRSTMLKLKNGMVVRNWRFLPNKKIKICTGALHGGRNDECTVFSLPETC
jgi:hypothetical protein